MTPPRALPPGHFVGDGHNHGAEAEDHLHNHAHESPEDHLHHMQERQAARGRATLEEFHQAARETAQLTSGQRPETARPQPPPRGEPRAQGREPNAPRSNAPENRQSSAGSESRGPNRETTSSSAREFRGLARIFSAAVAAFSNGTSAFAEAGRQAIRQARPQPDQAAFRQPAGSESAARGPTGPETTGPNSKARSLETGPEPRPILQVLSKLPAAFPEAGPRAHGLQKILLQEAAVSPELLASLPPTLRSLVQQLMGSSGTLLPQLLPKLTAAGFAQALQVLFGQGVPANLEASRSGAALPLRGLGLLLGALLFAPGTGARPLSPGLLQRLEKALLQFLQLLSAKPAKEATNLDKALLEQLAALVAAEEKRRKEKERTRKKEEVSTALRAKRDSDFNEAYG